MIKRINYHLVIGLFLVMAFFVVSIVGPKIAPYDINYSKKIGYTHTSQGDELVSSPFPPSHTFVLGTDKWGYDILTILLYGLKYTLYTVCVIALLRVLIGSSIGIYQALKVNTVNKGKSGISLFSGIPHFIFIYFFMIGISIAPVLSPITLIIIQSSLMTVLGVPGVYNVTFKKTKEINRNLFVEASKILGGNRFHIMKKHIFPMLKGNLSIIFVTEVIQTLHLIGQLGIFNLFLGGTKLQVNPTIYLSITNEWSGLIGQSRAFLYQSQWIILFPLLAYFSLLFSFYLLSHGLNQRQRMIQRRIPYI